MNSRILATTLTVLIAVTLATQALADTWTDYDDIGPDLLAYQTAYPNLAQRYDLGTSVQGRHLWAIKISDNVTVEEDEPEFKYVSTMHGDEIVGTKMCMMLIDHLLTNYGTDPECTRIIDEVELWIVPLMNPDGYDRTSRTRYNANGDDLNRSFPEGTYSEPNTTSGRPPEVGVIMNWTAQHSFVCCANFHGGELVANYPYDKDYGISSGSPAPSPDDDVFVQMALSYTTQNSTMYNSSEFLYGITNGSAWYSIDGGMQDWNYRYHHTNSMTFEIHATKQPSSSQIATFWNLNRQAMIDYIENCLIGVRGVVTDASTGAPLAATVSVSDRSTVGVTDPDVGDYHRILLPGTYNLTFEVDGYEPLTISNVVVNAGDATRLDVQMAGPPEISSPNGGETLAVGTPTTVSWTGSPVGQFQVQYATNYGETGTETDGFERDNLESGYETGGNADWYIVQNGNAHTGAKNARTGDISDGQQTWMTRVAGQGSLSFWYRVSCESTYDKFRFSVDGERNIETWGIKPWRRYFTTLDAGEHLLKWEYEKDAAGSYYEDAVFIDDFTMTGDITNWTDIVTLTAPGTTSVSWTPPVASTDYKVRVRQYYAAGSYSSWDESDAVFSAVAGPDGDSDDDGDIDIVDFAAFQACFGATPDTACTDVFDFDDDDDIDLADYTAFEALLLGSGPAN